MVVEIENKLRGFPVVLGALQASTKDICAECTNFSAAQIKLSKMLKAMRKDFEETSVPEEKKRELSSKIDEFSDTTDGLQVAEECTCQKTVTNVCTIAGCFVNGAVDLMKLITEPPATTHM